MPYDCVVLFVSFSLPIDNVKDAFLKLQNVDSKQPIWYIQLSHNIYFKYYI